MNIRTIVDTLSIHELKARFDKEVNTSHITYDWDGGHCYASIHHPIMDEIDAKFECINQDAHDEMLDYTNDWLSEHEQRPPCQIHVFKDGSVASGCGCHDHLDPVQEAEEIQDILWELTKLQRSTNNKYLITCDEKGD